MNTNLLRSKRVLHGYNQTKMGEMLGISRKMYSLKETGKRDFKVIELKKISKALKFDLDDVNKIFLDDEI